MTDSEDDRLKGTAGSLRLLAGSSRGPVVSSDSLDGDTTTMTQSYTLIKT